MRLIDADALLKKCIEGDGDNQFTEGYNFAVQEISAYITLAQTIEAEPVRHGRWIPYGRDTAYTKYYRCSLCGYEIVGYAESDDLIKYNYCPNCGSDMREASKDADDN